MKVLQAKDMAELAENEPGFSLKAEVPNWRSELNNALIMIVDDEPIMLDILQAYLEEKGYHKFITTDQSTQALDILTRIQPDVVLLDLVMPEVNGFEILAAVRANKDTEQTPVIVLTSAGDTDTKLKALELGATDFLAKPVDPSEVALRLRNILTVKAYQDHLAVFDSLRSSAENKQYLNRLDYSDTSEIQVFGIDPNIESVPMDRENPDKKNKTKILFDHHADWKIGAYEEYALIVSNEFNNFEPNDKKVIALYQEFYDALRPGGVLITNVLNSLKSIDTNSVFEKYCIDDAQEEKPVVGAILEANWKASRNAQQSRKLLEIAGFSIVSIEPDPHGLFSTVVAKKLVIPNL